MRMTWEQLAFIHWRIPAGVVQRQLPAGLELDTFDGAGWIGAVPFFMTNVGARGCPGIPTTANFLELNLRTYVTHNGKAGVWFFSLDAASWLCVRGARFGFHLPYFDADMEASVRDDVAYRSKRIHRDACPGEFRALYRPRGEVFQSEPGTLEHWLTERYCLYSADKRGNIYCGEIHHEPWPLQRADLELRENTLGNLLDADLSDPPESVLFSRKLNVVAWPISKVAKTAGVRSD